MARPFEITFAGERRVQGLRGYPPPDPPELALVALDDRGNSVGWAALCAALFGLPLERGTRFAWLYVEQRARWQGAGTALLKAVEEAARSAGVTAISASYADGDAAAEAFASRYGYCSTHRIVDLELCLDGYDLSPWQTAIEDVTRDGIRLSTLGQEVDPVAAERAIWELDQQLSVDVPEWSGEVVPFDQYREENFSGEGFDPQGVILAFDKDQLVGFSGTKAEVGEAGHTWFLGVARPYRGRRIAVAMKAMTIRWARARGLPRLRTNNNPASGSIIELNRRMGFTVTAARQYVRKVL